MYDHNQAASDFFQSLMRDPSFFEAMEAGGESDAERERPLRQARPRQARERFMRRPAKPIAADAPDSSGPRD